MLKIDDYVMNCCGMLSASGISLTDEGEIVFWDDDENFRSREITDEDWDKLFDKIEEAQYAARRACAIIALSSEQTDAAKQAERRGFKKVFEFQNMNSYNRVGLYVHVLWETRNAMELDYTRKDINLPHPLTVNSRAEQRKYNARTNNKGEFWFE